MPAISRCRDAAVELWFTVVKTFRILLLIAMAVGLTAGQALPVMTCGNGEARVACGSCCAVAGADCCEKGPAPTRSTPSQVATTSVDLKQAIVPVLISLGTQPCLVVPPASVQQRAFAQQPVQRRLDMTCIRLI